MANDTMAAQKGETAAEPQAPAVKKARMAEPAAAAYSEAEVAAMSARQYMDELVVPTLLRALASVNKERPVDPIAYLSIFLAKEKEDKAREAEQQEAKDSSTDKV